MALESKDIETGNEPVHSRSAMRAFSKLGLAGVLALLVSPLRPFGLVLLFLIALFGVKCLVYAFNRRAGHCFAAVMVLCCASYIYWQVSVELRFRQLETKLNEFSNVSARVKYFPIPRIYGLSIDYPHTDSDVVEILGMEELSEVESLHLESDKFSDQCLSTVAETLKLTYLFIDSDGITDAAITDFMERFPDCKVIPYQRGHLLDSDYEVFQGSDFESP